ncbi:MAG: hypothetical protein PHE50_10605 [Dehalococcoidales bacterium]|nr:hypothetical protein [Dehalococcoidales bacterium]
MKKLTLILTVAVVLVAAIASIVVADSGAYICYGKLVNGDIRPYNRPIANAHGYIVENTTINGYTDANGNFRFSNNGLGAGTYHVQFDGWTGLVAFYFNGTYTGTNVGTLTGHAQ